MKKIDERMIVSMSPPLKAAIKGGTIPVEQFVEELKLLRAVAQQMRRLPAPERAVAYHQVIDGYIAQTMEKPDPELTPTCRRGCFHCCYQNVDVIWDEAALLLEKYADQIDWERVQEQIDAVEVSKMPYAKRACVFLKDGQCSVYEDRPNSCRKYFVISDPDKCNAEKYPGGDVGSLYSHKAEIFASALMTLQDCGSMAQMLAKVLEKKK